MRRLVKYAQTGTTGIRRASPWASQPNSLVAGQTLILDLSSDGRFMGARS